MDYSIENSLEQASLSFNWEINLIPLSNNSPIDVIADKTQLNPHPIDHNPAKDLKSTIVVTVKDSNNQLVPNQQVEIKTCIVPSSISNDGHQNHDLRTNECDAGIAQTDKPKRPTATLNGISDTNVNPLILSTDTNGKITIIYISAKGYNEKY